MMYFDVALVQHFSFDGQLHMKNTCMKVALIEPLQVCVPVNKKSIQMHL